MLHELLLALSGDSGGIFVHKKFAGLQVWACTCATDHMYINLEDLFGANIIKTW